MVDKIKRIDYPILVSPTGDWYKAMANPFEEYLTSSQYKKQQKLSKYMGGNTLEERKEPSDVVDYYTNESKPYIK